MISTTFSAAKGDLIVGDNYVMLVLCPYKNKIHVVWVDRDYIKISKIISWTSPSETILCL